MRIYWRLLTTEKGPKDYSPLEGVVANTWLELANSEVGCDVDQEDIIEHISDKGLLKGMTKQAPRRVVSYYRYHLARRGMLETWKP